MFQAFVRFAVFGFAIALVVLAAEPSLGKADVEVTGEVRIRYEGDDRTFMNDAEIEHFILQRTRLQVTAHNDAGAGLVVQAQDSRQWGQEESTSADLKNLDLHQAYVHLSDPFGLTGLDFFGGRQELAYGRHRVIGDFGWDNVGRAFDAARLRFNFDEHWLDLAGGTVSDADFPGVTTEENVYLLVGHYEIMPEEFTVEPLLVYRERSTSRLYQTSLGGYAHFQKNRLGITGDVVYQTGDRPGGDVSAYLAAIDVGFDISPDADRMVGLKGGIDFYSGDDPADDGDTPYDFLYPTNHKFYGYMDLATALTADRDLGLRDVHFKIWLRTPQEIKLVGAFHHFTTDVETPIAGGDDTALGREIDVKLNKMLEEGMMIEIGGGIFLPGDVVESDPAFGDENAFWAYVQGTASF
jgi:hypothetical protein